MQQQQPLIWAYVCRLLLLLTGPTYALRVDCNDHFYGRIKHSLKKDHLDLCSENHSSKAHDPKRHHRFVCIIPVRNLLHVTVSNKFPLIHSVSANYIDIFQSTSIRNWAVTEINVELSFKEWELLYIFLLPNTYYNEEEFVVLVILTRVLTSHWHMSDIKTLWTKNSQ